MENVTASSSPPAAPVLQWWHVTGSYRVARGRPTQFSVWCARWSEAGATRAQRHCHSLVVATRRDRDAGWCVDARIDAMALQAVRRQTACSPFADADSHVARAYAREIAAHGAPAPFARAAIQPVWKEDPFLCEWEKLQLAEHDAGWHMRFRDPATNHQCTLELDPGFPWFSLACDGGHVALTACTVKGRAGARTLSGHAVITRHSHHTGSASAARGICVAQLPRKRIMAAILQPARSVRARPRLRGFIVEHDGTTTRFQCALRAVRSWTSPTTYVTYPLAWEARLPAHVRVQFTSGPHERELPWFGTARTLWHGSGRLTVETAGAVRSGDAQLVLYGWGSLSDLNVYTDPLISTIDKWIEEFLPRAFTDERVADYVGRPRWQHDGAALTAALSVPVWDLMSRRGKHWRPIYGLLLARAAGASLECYARLLGVVIELGHTGTLIIDDIEDDSTTRRGRPCIHLLHGTDLAINAGTLLYFLIFLQVDRFPGLTDTQRFELMRILTNAAVRGHVGQGTDLYYPRIVSHAQLAPARLPRFFDCVRQLYVYKGGFGAEACADIAAVLADFPDRQRRALAAFGRWFGVAFQIIDDVRSFSCDPKWTKPCGEDLACGKPTYVILKAVQHLRGRKRARLVDILCKRSLREEPTTLAEGVALVRESGALALSRRDAHRMFEKAWRQCVAILPPSEARILLYAFCTRLLRVLHET